MMYCTVHYSNNKFKWRDLSNYRHFIHGKISKILLILIK